MALHLFIYLLGSLPPLSQPIEAIAGVQPVVGVVVLTHSLPKTTTSHSSLFLLLCFFSLSTRLVSFPPLHSETKRADLSPLWSSLSGLCGAPRRRGGAGGSGRRGGGEKREGRGGEGGGRTMVLLWQQLPPVFIWKPCRGTKIVPARALTRTAT